MGLAWEIQRAGRRRQVSLPRARVPVPPAPVEDLSGAVFLSALTKLKVGGTSYLPGQRVRGPSAELVPLLREGAIWRVAPSGVDWWAAPGRVLAVEPCDDTPLVSERTEGALRIAMGCGYDPGNAVYRMHSMVNEHTKHASAFITWRKPGGNPFRCPQQYDALKEKPEALRALVYEADVLHHHVDYFLRNAGLGNKPRPGQLLLRHYHGSTQGAYAAQHAVRHAEVDDALGALLLGARLTLCALRPGRIQWMPITVPVDRYAAMVAERPTNVLRIAHSATKDEYKGTRDLIEIVDELRAKGLRIELALIGYKRKGRSLVADRKSHADALRMKAECHVTVDSVHWLGLQGSGLEGAAMGQAVLAGDPDVAALYRQELGSVPYTHIEGDTTAERRKSLKALLERLATDPGFLDGEAERAHRYVRDVHDYPAVAHRYEGILAKALGRSDVLTHTAQVH